MLTRVSNSFSMALGKKSVTVSRTDVYRDTVTKTLLAEMAFPRRTYSMNVMNKMILLAQKKDAMLRPRRYELIMIFEISFLKQVT